MTPERALEIFHSITENRHQRVGYASLDDAVSYAGDWRLRARDWQKPRPGEPRPGELVPGGVKWVKHVP
jgi:hypothetical protein